MRRGEPAGVITVPSPVPKISMEEQDIVFMIAGSINPCPCFYQRSTKLQSGILTMRISLYVQLESLLEFEKYNSDLGRIHWLLDQE